MPRAVSYGTLEADEPEVIVISSSLVEYRSDRETGERAPLQPLRRQTRRTNNCSCASYCCVACVVLMIGILCFILFWSWAILTISCFSPLHPPHPVRRYSDFQNQSFTVGFDLTAGYGTASVSFYNGTVVDVARVEASPRYNEVLKRLSDPSSAHPSPPYYNCEHSFNDIPRQWARYLRKKRGKPASPEVAALTDMLGNLKDQVDVFLIPYGTLEMAFITVPHLPAIYTEDLLDAAEHVKFQLLYLPNYRTGDQAQWPVNELNAAMEGNGVESLTSIGTEFSLARSDHEKEAPGQYHGTEVESNSNTFLVLYTRTALTAFVGPFWGPTYYYSAAGIANFSMGLSQCSERSDPQMTGECPPEAPYWLELRNNLRTALASYYRRGNDLARVVSWGESAHDTIFAAILEQEVLAAQDTDDPAELPRFYSEFPEFSAARGAAEFGKICSRSAISFACIPDIRPRVQGW